MEHEPNQEGKYRVEPTAQTSPTKQYSDIALTGLFS